MSVVVSLGTEQRTAAANLRTLISTDVKSGVILYLPLKDEVMESLADYGSLTNEPVVNLTSPSNRVGDKFYNHPILVISRPSEAPNTIHFLLLTTFRGKTIDKRFKSAGTRRELDNYLAIKPSPDHPFRVVGNPMYPTLRLRDGATMPRCGYAKISEVYAMEWRLSQPCWGDSKPPSVQRWRLDDESLSAALRSVSRVSGYEPGKQYDARAPMNRRVLHPLQTLAKTLTAVAGPSTATENRTVSVVPPTRTARNPAHTAPAKGTTRPSHTQQRDDAMDQTIDESRPLLGGNQREAPKSKIEPSVIRFICLLIVRVKQAGLALRKCVRELTSTCFGVN